VEEINKGVERLDQKFTGMITSVDVLGSSFKTLNTSVEAIGSSIDCEFCWLCINID
jgi:hypothetical protein